MTESSPNPVAIFVCPFCGGATPDQPRCAQCAGPLDPLSRQATQNAMGPWFIRDEQHPFRPGCSYETILGMVARGKISAETILRGPSTSQFWYPARRVPGVAHRLVAGGVCYACQQPVHGESECPKCGAVFHGDPDRQFLGLMPVRPLPGSGIPETPHAEPAQTEQAPVQPVQAGVARAAPPVHRSMSGSRLEAEIATLRVRSWMLSGVAAICGMIALGAIWVLVSGAAQNSVAKNSANPPTGQSAPSVREPTRPSAPPEHRNKESEGLPTSEQPSNEPEPAQAPNSGEKPAAPSDSKLRSSPVPEAIPSQDLADLRATRWP